MKLWLWNFYNHSAIHYSKTKRKTAGSTYHCTRHPEPISWQGPCAFLCFTSVFALPNRNAMRALILPAEIGILSNVGMWCTSVTARLPCWAHAEVRFDFRPRWNICMAYYIYFSREFVSCLGCNLRLSMWVSMSRYKVSLVQGYECVRSYYYFLYR